MRRTLIICSAALLLLSCEERRYTYPPPSESPMAPQPSPRPSPPRVGYIAPTPAPKSVKPLHVVLTSQNVGGYMDGEEHDLRVALRGSGVGVARPGDAMTLYLRDDMLFLANSSAVSPHGAQVLSAIAAVTQRYDATILSVNGYTDASAPPDRAVVMSQERADAVAQALIASGVDKPRIAVHALGAAHPKVPTGPGISETRNLRVEIVITPKMQA